MVNTAFVTIRELKGDLGDVGQYKSAWLKDSGLLLFLFLIKGFLLASVFILSTS